MKKFVISFLIGIVSIFIWFNCNPFLSTEAVDNIEDSSLIVSGDAVKASEYTETSGEPMDYFAELANWKWTSPIDVSPADGLADEVEYLANYEYSPYFISVNDGNSDGIVFRATAGGAKTSANTCFARSELREMTQHPDVTKNWSAYTGTHRLSVTERCLELPQNRPVTVTAQIHSKASDGVDDDVLMIRVWKASDVPDPNSGSYTGKIALHCTLAVAAKNTSLPSNPQPVIYTANGFAQDTRFVSNYVTVLNDDYAMTEYYSIDIEAVDDPASNYGLIYVWYYADPDNPAVGSFDRNNAYLAVKGYYQNQTDQGSYFKAGNYVQSNTTNGGTWQGYVYPPDLASAYSETLLKRLVRTHQ